jgi:hypothetical protein
MAMLETTPITAGWMSKLMANFRHARGEKPGPEMDKMSPEAIAPWWLSYMVACGSTAIRLAFPDTDAITAAALSAMVGMFFHLRHYIRPYSVE